MKKVGVWNYYESLNKENYLLLNKDAGMGDDLLYSTNLLYNEGKKLNIDFMTLDMIDSFEDMNGFIFLDFPNMTNNYVKKVFKTNIPKYLIIFETELIRIDNWDLDKHKYFDKIFTWKDDIIDSKKYFKFNFAQEIPNSINKDISKKEKLCTLIAGNKKNNHPFELYSKRVEAIRWFEKNHINDFDLYGIGWDKYKSSNKYINFILTKLGLLKLLAKKYPSYKGKVDNKKLTLEKYKFVICYENARDIPGYITEKIFDSFFAGCIPIYWGASNVEEHIPKNCFIDKKKFDSYEELYDFINNMTLKKHNEYLFNIESFLNSNEINKFSSEYFVKNILDNLIND